MRNLHCRCVLWSNGQIYGGDFAKLCGLFRIYEFWYFSEGIGKYIRKICFLETGSSPPSLYCIFSFKYYSKHLLKFISNIKKVNTKYRLMLMRHANVIFLKLKTDCLLNCTHFVCTTKIKFYKVKIKWQSIHSCQILF